MDIYCSTCAEPWDNDELHEIAAEEGISHSEALARFKKEGCALFGSRHGDEAPAETRALIAEAFALGGDDVDGIASDLEAFL